MTCEFSLAQIVRRWAKAAPDEAAVVHAGNTITWAQLRRRSELVAAALRAEGVGPQHRVAILDKNDPSQFEIIFGSAMANIVPVPVNWRLTAGEVAQIVNDADARLLFVGAEFAPLVADLEPRLTTVKRIVVIGGSTNAGPTVDYEPWLHSNEPQDPQVRVRPGDVALQLYTSGTTGLPKGVILTTENLCAFLGLASALRFSPSAVNLVTMPLFHIGGLGWAFIGMVEGARTVMLREFDVGAVLDAIPEQQVTHALLVPAMLLFVTLDPRAASTDFASLEVMAYGAAPISEELVTTCLRLFDCGFYQLYGLTETTGAVTLLAPADHLDGGRPERLRSAGRPVGDVEVRIDGAGGDGEVGEVLLRSKQVMKGYWGKPDETAAVITDDGWFRTGDAGFMRDGYLYLHDRVKDMIVSGGENVFPAEVENVLMKHPAVADVAVIGVPSERWGEEVKAIVVLVAQAEPVAAEDLIDFARVSLAGFKAPKSVDFVDALPRNPSGKILKRELRAPYWAGRGRSIG